MVMKFADRPQLLYNGGDRISDWPAAKKPNNNNPNVQAYSMASAPENSPSPIVVYDENNRWYRAHHRKDAWRQVVPHRDHISGEFISWMETGHVIASPTKWHPPVKKR
jgi:hypothetical protein